MDDFSKSNVTLMTSGIRCFTKLSTRIITVSVACQKRPLNLTTIVGPSNSTNSISPVMPALRDPASYPNMVPNSARTSSITNTAFSSHNSIGLEFNAPMCNDDDDDDDDDEPHDDRRVASTGRTFWNAPTVCNRHSNETINTATMATISMLVKVRE
jgi:hypothetical protein